MRPFGRSIRLISLEKVLASPEAEWDGSTWVTDLIAAYCTWAVRCGQSPDAATCNAFAGPEFAVVHFNQASAAITAVSDGKAQFD